MPDTHPIIALFENGAQLLDAEGRQADLDDAIVGLASWMGLAQDRLTEDDIAVLAQVGAILYREGLRRRG